MTIADLGSAKRLVIDKDNTTVIDGAGKEDAIKARVSQIRAQASKKLHLTMIVKNYKSVWLNWLAVLPLSMLVLQLKLK
jgi:hypothetical protein